MKPTGEYLPSSNPAWLNGWRWYFKFTYKSVRLLLYVNFELGYNSHLLPVLRTYKVDSKLQTRTGGGNSTCQKSRAWLTSLSGLLKLCYHTSDILLGTSVGAQEFYG
jgi:hypothetical protein